MRTWAGEAYASIQFIHGFKKYSFYRGVRRNAGFAGIGHRRWQTHTWRSDGLATVEHGERVHGDNNHMLIYNDVG